MLCYFGYLSFPCLNYQPTLGQCSFLYPRDTSKKQEGICRFNGVWKSNICLKLVNNRAVVLLICFHFVFWFVFWLSILKALTLYRHRIISRLFHLNEISDSIVTDPAIKMCLESHRGRKKLDYQFTIICCFSRSRMRSFSIYLT